MYVNTLQAREAKEPSLMRFSSTHRVKSGKDAKGATYIRLRCIVTVMTQKLDT